MKKINLIMPMAGGGTRFKKEGIEVPKPLIDLKEKPFFYWATQSITKFIELESIVFIVLKEHIEKYKIDEEIYKYYPKAKLQVIDKVLNGAVLTCLEGIKLIDNDNPILLNDCDHAFLCEDFYKFCRKNDFNEIDGALLTFTSNNPRFSFVELDEKNNVIKTIEKVAISDKAICGAYYFKNKNIFKEAVDEYLESCDYEEFFVSGVYNVMAEKNLLIKYFLTDEHISFGTPEEYKEAKKYNFDKFI